MLPLSTVVQLTSTSLTTPMINSSSSSPVTSNQPKTTSSELEQTDLSLSTSQTPSQNNQSSTNPVLTTKSTPLVNTKPTILTSTSLISGNSTTLTSTINLTGIPGNTTNSASSEMMSTGTPLSMSFTTSTAIEENLTNTAVSIAHLIPFLALFPACDFGVTLRFRLSYSYQIHPKFSMKIYMHACISLLYFFLQSCSSLVGVSTHHHSVVALHVFMRTVRMRLPHSSTLEDYQLGIYKYSNNLTIAFSTVRRCSLLLT